MVGFLVVATIVSRNLTVERTLLVASIGVAVALFLAVSHKVLVLRTEHVEDFLRTQMWHDADIVAWASFFIGLQFEAPLGDTPFDSTQIAT